MKRGDFLISTAALIGSTAVFTKLSAVAQETPVKGGTLIWGSLRDGAASRHAPPSGFAIDTETLGFVTSPGHRCVTAGLCPTFGRVPRTGAMTPRRKAYRCRVAVRRSPAPNLGVALERELAAAALRPAFPR